MDQLSNDFKHLKIQLKDIMLATKDFKDEAIIGRGGFGTVYKGELTFPEGKKTVAFKRLDRYYGQGDVEFWKEIMMLAQYKDNNLVSLLGYCDENSEKILVYEYVCRGSLDRYLGDSNLTWLQRLKICHGAACGLNYLHDPKDMHQRVLHRDVKSANILLDEDFTAKIADFGLSKIGPANQQYSYVVSKIVGTPGYCDPVYVAKGIVSKESDVYSFGVVLFEVMCGRQCFDYCNSNRLNILVPEWKMCCEQNRIHDIVSTYIKREMEKDTDMYSLKVFANIAYRCLDTDRKRRPTMAEISNELRRAIHHHMSKEVDEKAYKEFFSTADQLSKESLLVQGEHSLVRNENGEYCELISGLNCVPLGARRYQHQIFSNTGLFDNGKGFPTISMTSSNDLVANPQFLSANVTYSINLIYKYLCCYKGAHVPLKYKLQEETKYWTSCVAQRRNQWLITELYQFTSYQRKHEFSFEVVGRLHPDHFKECLDGGDEECDLFFLGIEFLPVGHEKDENKVGVQLSMDLDTDWEKILPSDYAEIVKRSKFNKQWTNYKELYSLLREGFLIKTDVDKWFSVSKNMKKRHMLPAIAVLQEGPASKNLPGTKQWIWKSMSESRFELVAECGKIKGFTIACEIESQLLSLETTYACYLVYKLPKKHSMVDGLVQIDDETHGDDEGSSAKQQLVDLLSPTHIPVLRRHVDESQDIPSRIRKIKGHPKIRKDGWLEIQIWEFQTGTTHNKSTSMNCHLRSYDNWNLTGLLVQGIEFRPAKVSFQGLKRFLSDVTD